MALVLVVDLLLGTDLGLLPVYAVGPALAAARGSVRSVLEMGVVATGLCLAAAAYSGSLGKVPANVALGAIAYVTLAASYVGARRLRTERELLDAREVASAVEAMLLPPLPPAPAPVELAASYVSASSAARVGGDLYGAVRVGDSVRVVVADVQGKGLDAVRSAAVVLSAFRESAPYVDSLTTVGTRIELALQRLTGSERFATAVLAEIGADGSVAVLNRGHPGPLLLRPAHPPKAPQVLDAPVPELPFGLAALADAPESDPEPTRFTLEPGERVLFYTDGLTEARDAEGRFYPLLDRAAGPLSDPSPDAALRRLRADVALHTGAPPDDDSALLLVDFANPAREPRG
jgi:serine phosphatase RsbU (regulator of sigma subunit)